jgi:hypothetical protein
MRRVLLILAALLLMGTGVAAASPTIVAVSAPTSPLGGCAPFDTGPGTKYPSTEVEPWLAVNPTNANNIVGSWQQDRWSSGGAAGSGVGVSVDGGATFTPGATGYVPGQTVCTGGTGAAAFARASDPWLTFAPDGTLYQMSLVETKLPTGVNNPSGMAVNRSYDGGLTWGQPTFVAYDTDPSLFNDKNSITADPTPTRTGYVYAIWDRLDSPPGKGSLKSVENTSGFRGPTVLARTTNGGDSWEPPRVIFNPGTANQTIGNQIVVQPDGTLVDVFTLIRNDNKGQVKGYSVAVIRSTDGGTTWDAKPTTISPMTFVQVTDPDTAALVRTGDLIPEIAVDRTSGPTRGNLYVVWQDGRWAGGTHAHVAFSRSTDGGRTWSSPTQIDRAPTAADAFTPSIAVDPNGRVGVSYYDFRSNTAAAGLPTKYWFTSCSSSCTSLGNWAESQVDGPFNMENAPVARGYFLGDYEGIATTGNDFGLLYARSGTAPNTADVVFTRVTP